MKNSRGWWAVDMRAEREGAESGNPIGSTTGRSTRRTAAGSATGKPRIVPWKCCAAASMMAP